MLDYNLPTILSTNLLKELQQAVSVNIDFDKSGSELPYTILNYVHSLFDHDGDSEPSQNDPLTIYTEALRGGKFRCVEYSILATGILWAFGVPSRVVGLKTKDVETRKYGAGHVVVEFWNKRLSKWVMADPQAGVIPTTQDGNELSAYELRTEMYNGNQASCMFLDTGNSRARADFTSPDQYLRWLSEYLYFIDTPLHINFEHKDRSQEAIVMLVPDKSETPHLFQGLFAMNVRYIIDPTDFYPSPE